MLKLDKRIKLDPVPSYEKELVVVSCFKNEAKYIQEWLEYNLIMGVEHFYLYNNESTDNWQEVLDSYMQDGLVTVIDWPERPVQPACYNHFLSVYGDNIHWAAFIDCDEFIAVKDRSSIRAVLDEYEPYAGLACSWTCFGPNGHVEPPEGLLIDNYTTRQSHYETTWLKNIVQPRRVLEYTSSHTLTRETDKHTGKQFEVVTQNHKPTNINQYILDDDFNKIRIFHYVTKSESEFDFKLNKRGNAETKSGIYITWNSTDRGNWGNYQKRFKTSCTIKDEFLRFYSDEIKSRIRARKER